MAGGRQGILEAAGELFATRGYTDTSLRDIADDAGIKAGSIYYHFASKEELYVEVMAIGIDLMDERFEAVAATAPDDPHERLREHVRGHLEVLHAHHPFTTVHVGTFRTAPEAVRDRVVPRRDAYEARWTRLLSELRPELSRRELGIVRLSLMGAMNSSVDWFDRGRGGLDLFTDVVTDAFVAGARSPEAA